ncbi:hypothetical protein EV426DRAFT_153623 [Tirmania nivea]|nr:hypothetical protein EV426DRAFT_153623 [Tirmania nivea]
MANIGSNNPFRNSFVSSDDENTSSRSLPPPSHPLQKSPSTTTTILEEDESEAMTQQRQFSWTGSTGRSSSPSPVPPPTPPPTGPLPAIPQGEPNFPSTAYILDGNKSKSSSVAGGTNDGHILITIQSTGSSTSTPPHTGIPPTHRLSMDPAQEHCNMWPALRSTQKSRIKSKRTWIIIKVAIATVIVVGAVAVGLGISKAVNDAKQ